MLAIAKMVDFPDKFKQKLQMMSVDTLAVRCGFVQRTPRKIHPQSFLISLFLAIFHGAYSLVSFAATLGLVQGQCVSKQAINKRITEPLIRLLEELLAKALAEGIHLHLKPTHHLLSTAFRRVLVHDSTNISLHPSLAKHFPGPRNSTLAQSATVKIQAIFDLLSERFRYFRITPFTVNDQSAATDMLDCVHEGDLIIRDLGYFVLRTLSAIQSKGAFFLSRLKYGIALYAPNGETPLDLLRMLKKRAFLDIDVCVGSKEKLPVRLVALPVCPQIAAQRRRALKRNRDYRLNPSKDHLTLLGWDIFVLNVDQSILSADTVAQIYHLRWRIEIIFKAWKSYFRLADVPYSSVVRVQLYLYLMLIFITLFHASMYAPLSAQVSRSQKIDLSLLKLSKFFKEQWWTIIVFSSHASNVQRQILYHCKYESRRKRQNFSQQLALLG